MPGGNYSAENRTRLFGHSACGCIAADFNEDGWVDLAVAHHKTYGSHPGYSKIWWNGPEGFSPARVTKLPTLGPHGMLAVDPGNIIDRKAEEYYLSSPFKLPENTRVKAIRWNAELQAKIWVKAQIRFAPDRELLREARWQGPPGLGAWFENGEEAAGIDRAGDWIQYRLAPGRSA